MSEQEPYQFGGIDWSSPSPERCAANDRRILEAAQSAGMFRRFSTSEQPARFKFAPDGLQIGWKGQ